jgi:hypothetical protein
VDEAKKKSLGAPDTEDLPPAEAATVESAVTDASEKAFQLGIGAAGMLMVIGGLIAGWVFATPEETEYDAPRPLRLASARTVRSPGRTRATEGAPSRSPPDSRVPEAKPRSNRLGAFTLRAAHLQRDPADRAKAPRHYIGAIRQYVEGQDRGDPAIYCIVDLHAITVPWDPAVLRENVYDTTAILLAAGLDPDRCILFRQSDVREHTELTWHLAALTAHGDLNRMTQFKEKSAKQRELVSAGLFFYPVLQAADVLAYKAEEVPVGRTSASTSS